MMYYVFKGNVTSSSSTTDPSFKIVGRSVEYIIQIDINSPGVLKHPDGISENLPYREVTGAPYSFYDGYYFAELISGNLFQLTPGLDNCCFLHYREYLIPEMKQESSIDAHINTLTFSSKLVNDWSVGDNFIFSEEGSGFKASVDLQLTTITDNHLITRPHIVKKFVIWEKLIRFLSETFTKLFSKK